MRSLMPTTLCVFVSEVNHPDAKRSAVFNVSPTTPLYLIVGERKREIHGEGRLIASDLPIDR